MSYDICLVDPITKEPLHADTPHQMRGGTYCPDGTTEMSLNITYNYAPHFHRTLGGDEVELSFFDRIFGGGDTGIRKLYGMTGAESIPVIEKAVVQLGDDVDEDYWKSTEGNAKRSLLQLLALAKMRPDGVWSGD